MSKHERQKERGEARAFKVRLLLEVLCSAGWSQPERSNRDARPDTKL